MYLKLKNYRTQLFLSYQNFQSQYLMLQKNSKKPVEENDIKGFKFKEL